MEALRQLANDNINSPNAQKLSRINDKVAFVPTRGFGPTQESAGRNDRDCHRHRQQRDVVVLFGYGGRYLYLRIKR